MINDIYEQAFNDELEKMAGVGSEIAASLFQGPFTPLIGGISTLVSKPYTEKQREKINKATWSNLIPGVAPARLGRRVKTALTGTKKEKKK